MVSNIIERRIGSVIGYLRAERGETQQELANIIGVKRETINQWECGTRYIKAGSIIKLAKHFDVSADYILGISENRSSNLEIKDMCKYTGLSEEAIKTIHDLNAVTDTLYKKARDDQPDNSDDGEDDSLLEQADSLADIYDALNDFLEHESCLEFFASLVSIYKAIQYANMLIGFYKKADEKSRNTYQVLESLERARQMIKYSIFELLESSKKIAQVHYHTEDVDKELTEKIKEVSDNIPISPEEEKKLASVLKEMLNLDD